MCLRFVDGRLSKARISRRWESLLREVPAGSPRRGEPGLRLGAWRPSRRSASSSPPAAPGSRPSRRGCASYGSRRVPGLRREEVAVLAGVSVPYYTRLERGDIERRLRQRAGGAGPSAPARRRRARPPLRPRPRRAADRRAARAGAGQAARPARGPVDPRRDHRRRRVRGQRAPRHPGRQPARPRAVLRAVRRARRGRSTPPGSSSSTREPRRSSATGTASPATSAAILRSAAGRDPYDRDLSDLVGELATQSEAFRTRWAAHNVRFHNTGVKHFHHPVVGDLHLTYNRLDLAADPGLTLVHLHRRARLPLRGRAEAPRQLGSHRRRRVAARRTDLG